VVRKIEIGGRAIVELIKSTTTTTATTIIIAVEFFVC